MCLRRENQPADAPPPAAAAALLRVLGRARNTPTLTSGLVCCNSKTRGRFCWQFDSNSKPAATSRVSLDPKFIFVNQFLLLTGLGLGQGLVLGFSDDF